MRLALAQLLVEGGEAARNLERAEKLIAQAAQQKADIVLLPETIDFAWTHPRSINEAEPIPGKYSNAICEMAKKYGVYICVGLTEKTPEGNYNTSIFVNSNGEIIHKYSKINLLTVEFPYYKVGGSLSVVDTPWGKIGINICADNYYDSLHIGHTLARMGAQLILSPSSWTVDYSVTEIDDPYKDKWYKPFLILASTYNIIVASTTSVGYIVGGPYEGKKMVGCSLIVDKNGIIAQGLFNEFAGDLTITELTLSPPQIKGVEIGEMLKKRGYKFDEILNNG
jgi:predicted amidohydrolase